MITVEVTLNGELLRTVLIDNRLERTLRTGGRRGDYRVRFFGKRGRKLRDGQEAWVLDHPRLSADVLTLVRKALQEAGY